MTKYYYLTILLIIANFSYSQEISGKYSKDNEFINFCSDTAEFHIESDGGLIVFFNGKGKYELKEEFLLIHTNKYIGTKSTFSVSDNESGFATFTAKDTAGKFVLGVNIALLDETGNIVEGSATNEKGFLKIPYVDNAKSISISLVGYDSFIIDYKPNSDYSLTLFEEEVIENQTVVFKINENEKDILNLTLLATNFKFNPKTVLKDLKRQERKLSKYHSQEKELKRN